MSHLAPRIARYLLLTTALLGGCAYEDGGLLSSLYLDVPDCAERGVVKRFEPYEMDLHHLGLQTAFDGVTVRIGPSSAEAWRADQVVFSIPAAVIEAANGGPFRVELDAAPVGDPTRGRLSMALLRSCAVRSASLVGQGHIEVDTWGTSVGDRIAGRIVVDIVDPRTGEIRARGFGGEFDLAVRMGTPYTGFAPTHF